MNEITITINSKKETVEAQSSLFTLISSMYSSTQGIAAAINQTVVKRTEWENTILVDGDDILIIKATCGG